MSEEDQKTEPKPEPTDLALNAGEVDIGKLLDDPKVFEALMSNEKVQSTIKNAVEKATLVKPEEPKPEPKKDADEDLALIKRRILSDAIGKLDTKSLQKFTLETDGLSLTKKMAWIDDNVKNEPKPKPEPKGLPVGAGRSSGIFDEKRQSPYKQDENGHWKYVS